MNLPAPSGSTQWRDDATLLKAAVRLARFAGWQINVAENELHWSSELYELLGFDENLGQPPLERTLQLYPDGERRRIEEALQRCMVHGEAFDFEGTIFDRAGNTLQIRAIAEPVRDAAGVITRVDGAFYDISEIVREREERIAAQAALNNTLNYIPDMMCFVDRDWRLSFANAAVIQKTAPIDQTELFSLTIWELWPDLIGTSIERAYRRAMDERQSSTSRAHFADAERWIEATAHPVDTGIALVIRDVSADEQSQQRLHDLGQQALALTAMLDISNEAFITEDLHNRIEYWNSGAEQLYGFTKEEAIGRDIRELIYPDTADFEAANAELLATGRWSGELHQRAKDGRPIIVSCRWQAVLDDDGEPVSLFAVNSDVTELRRQQELQSRAQRLESLGTLAGGIAHDLNNMLTPVLMSIQLLKTTDPSPDQAQMLAGMEASVVRGAEMIRQVLTFARGVDGVRESVPVVDIVDELSALTLAVLPKSITVEKSIESTRSFAGDTTQVLQVLVNLVTNARDAMPDGGTLRVTASDAEVEHSSALASVLAPGPYVVIAVEDSGVGMAPEVLHRIFEPFFTTKGVGEGTGLGLASSQAIARSHGGYIEVDSVVGRGSRFALYLPVAESTAMPSRPIGSAPHASPAGAGEMVLVIDDEVSIRSAVCQTLHAHGYRTVHAGNGREAIEIYTAHAHDVRLVLTDMMMPIMDGAATAAFFSEHHPHVALVATSGLNEAAAVERARESGVQYFVAKPFSVDVLLGTIRDALGTHSSS